MKDDYMYLGLDNDTGRDDRAATPATPATRGDAEQALRDYTTGTSDVGSGPDEIGMSGDACEGLCPECAIEQAVKEAAEQGITPEDPAFGAIFESVFAEGNPDGNVKVTFLGAHKIGDVMPDELREKIEGLGFDLMTTNEPKGGLDFPFSASELEELIRTLPPIPSFFSGLKDLPLPPFLPLPPKFQSPFGYPAIIGEPLKDPSLDEMLARIFGSSGPVEGDGEDIEQERREVVQDLASAAADTALAISAEGGADMAAALRDIAALARDTYEI